MLSSRYTIKSFDVDAVQVTTENIHEVAQLCSGMVKDTGLQLDEPGGKLYIDLVVTPAPKDARPRRATAYANDWIVRQGNHFILYQDREFKDAAVPAQANRFDEVLELVREAMYGPNAHAREITRKILELTSPEF